MASLGSEAAGLLSFLQKVEERYNGHVLFMIFAESLVLLLILSTYEQGDFWPDPGSVVHFYVILRLIQNFEDGQRM